MPAQVEEAVLGCRPARTPSTSSQIRRAASSSAFARRGTKARASRPVRLRSRAAAPAVDLAVRGERQARRARRRPSGPCNSGRPPAEMRRAGRRTGGRPAPAARHRRPAASLPAASSRATTAASRDRRDAAERRLDLPQLDAEAADLHLVVDPPEVLEVAVGQAAGEVAGAVQPRAGSRRRDRGRSARRSAPARQIAAGHAGAADVDLPGHADRCGLEVAVEHVDGEVRDGRGRSGCLPRPSKSCRRIRRQVTCTVVSVMPYMLTSSGLSSPWRSSQGASAASSSASPAKIDIAQGERGRRRRRATAPPPRRAGRKADGVWLRTVTRSSREQLVERLGRAAHVIRHDHQPAAVERAPPRSPRPRSRKRRNGRGSRRRPDRSRTSSRWHRTGATTLACVTCTPFGRPVEPEV